MSVMSKHPPSDLEAEKSVLGIALQSSDAVSMVLAHITPAEMYKPAHQEILETVAGLHSSGEAVDLVTTVNALKATGQLDSAGGAAYLASLTETIPTVSKIPAYCAIIRDKFKIRQVIATANDMIARCHNNEPITSVIEAFGEGVSRIVTDKSTGATHLKKIMPVVFEEITYAHNNGVQTGMPTGFHDLDKRLAGLHPSDLIILAARPSMGKTALAMNISKKVASNGVGILFYSLEMSKEQLAKRLIMDVGRVDGDAIRKGFVADSEWPKITRACGVADTLNIHIDDTPGLSITEMQARAKMEAARHDVGMIVVDYLQLMSASAENRTQEVSAISRGLKGLAKSLNVPVLALSQLNRGLENRTDKRPQLSDLRESGAIEQDADVIMFIYRDEVYNKSPDNPNRGIAEIITGKQRMGPVGVDRLAWIGEYSSFENLTTR